MVRTASAFVALTVLAGAAGAQGLSESSLRVTPQILNYSIGGSGSKITVNQFAMPIAFAVPIRERLTFDVATAFATSSVKADGGDESSLAGLTDTQLRLNYTLGNDAVVITAGLSLPTGQYEVAEDKIAAASQIGNDFLSFPVSSFGSGMAATGGVAVARPLGNWNLGVAGSFRKSTEFGAFELDQSTLRFQPADEFRIRAGVDRFALGGRITAGLVFSVFGDDACEGCESGTSRTTYSTGNRIIAQAALDVPVAGRQLFVSGWLLTRGEGKNVGGTAPGETVLNLYTALGLTVGTFFLEPSLEIRRWTVDGEGAGSLIFVGARTQFDAGALQVSPSVSVGTGSFGVDGVDLSAFRIGATIQRN